MMVSNHLIGFGAAESAVRYSGDILTGSFTYAGSSTDSGSLANTYDNSLATAWGTADSATLNWWEVNFGSAKTILAARCYFNTNADGIDTLTIYGSSTGSFGGEEVIVHQETPNQTWAADETVTMLFTNPGSYQYYRIWKTAGSAVVGRLFLKEVEMFESGSNDSPPVTL